MPILRLARFLGGGGGGCHCNPPTPASTPMTIASEVMGAGRRCLQEWCSHVTVHQLRHIWCTLSVASTLFGLSGLSGLSGLALPSTGINGPEMGKKPRLTLDVGIPFGSGDCLVPPQLPPQLPPLLPWISKFDLGPRISSSVSRQVPRDFVEIISGKPIG